MDVVYLKEFDRAVAVVLQILKASSIHLVSRGIDIRPSIKYMQFLRIVGIALAHHLEQVLVIYRPFRKYESALQQRLSVRARAYNRLARSPDGGLSFLVEVAEGYI